MALTSEVKAGLVTAAATLAVGLLTLNQALVGVFYDDGIYAGLAVALAARLATLRGDFGLAHDLSATTDQLTETTGASSGPETATRS